MMCVVTRASCQLISCVFKGVTCMADVAFALRLFLGARVILDFELCGWVSWEWSSIRRLVVREYDFCGFCIKGYFRV